MHKALKASESLAEVILLAVTVGGIDSILAKNDGVLSIVRDRTA